MICKIDISNKKRYATIGEDVVCIPQTLDKEGLEPCTRQEADGRIILHVADAAEQGYYNRQEPLLNLQGRAGVFF